MKYLRYLGFALGLFTLAFTGRWALYSVEEIRSESQVEHFHLGEIEEARSRAEYVLWKVYGFNGLNQVVLCQDSLEFWGDYRELQNYSDDLNEYPLLLWDSFGPTATLVCRASSFGRTTRVEPEMFMIEGDKSVNDNELHVIQGNVQRIKSDNHADFLIAIDVPLSTCEDEPFFLSYRGHSAQLVLGHWAGFSCEYE